MGGLYVGIYSILLFIVGSSASERLAKFNKRQQNRVGKQKKGKKKVLFISAAALQQSIDIFPDELLGVCVRLLCYYFGTE